MRKSNNNISIIKHKVYTLLILILLFAIIYLLYDDTNFGGINNIQELIKDELLKNKIQKEIKEKFYNEINVSDDAPDIKGSRIEEKTIDDTTKEIKKDVKQQELKVEKIKPTIIQRLFNRLYFSVTTGTTLGYGDIYPKSNSVKMLSMIQTLSTIILILL
tara:strand:- start:948 stop:1427 length:480 start_codon:yes stop_codon:yes gene_type:complete